MRPPRSTLVEGPCTSPETLSDWRSRGGEHVGRLVASLAAIPVMHVLMVDPVDATSTRLARRIAPLAHMTTRPDFTGARQHLLATPPDLLVTPLRLGPYNGLHLVYLASAFDLATRSIVSVESDDAAFVPEIHRAGAFCEPAARLEWALPSYLCAPLASRDRRDTFHDRRLVPRGGRRVIDARSRSLPAP